MVHLNLWSKPCTCVPFYIESAVRISQKLLHPLWYFHGKKHLYCMKNKAISYFKILGCLSKRNVFFFMFNSLCVLFMCHPTRDRSDLQNHLFWYRNIISFRAPHSTSMYMVVVLRRNMNIWKSSCHWLPNTGFHMAASEISKNHYQPIF